MNRRKNPQGIALAWTVLMMFVMVGIVGLSIDWGKMAWNVHQMQNAGDSAALAGAHTVKYISNLADANHPRRRAYRLAMANIADGTSVNLDLNESNDPNGEIVLGQWNRATRIFTATTEFPDAVKVVVSREGQRAEAPRLRLLFGPLFWTDDVKATRPAIALSIGSMGAGIICLSERPEMLPGPSGTGDSGLTGAGATIDLTGPDGWIGDFQVNSRSEDMPKAAINVNGVNTKITAGEVNTCGTTNPSADEPDLWEPYYGGEPFNVNDRMPYIDDPLREIDPPEIATMPVPTTATITGGTITLDPGYYPGGINMPNGNITLNPGVYAFGGGSDGKSGFVVGGGAVTGNGVMIYVTGDKANAIEYGKIDVGANAVLNLISRGDAADPKEINGEMGVVLWQDRENNEYAKIAGGGTCDLTGTIYCPSCKLSLSGDFDHGGNQIICGALDVSGSVYLGVGYDGRNFIKSQRSVLVE